MMQRDYTMELLAILFHLCCFQWQVKNSLNSTWLILLCLSILEVIASVIIKPGGISPSWSGSVCDGVPGIRRIMVWGTVSEDSHHPPVWYDWQEPLTRHVLLVLTWVCLFLLPSKGSRCDISETQAKRLKDCLKPFYLPRHTWPLVPSEPVGGECHPWPLSAFLHHGVGCSPLLLPLCGSWRCGPEDILPLQHLRPDRVRIRGWAFPQLPT